VAPYHPTGRHTGNGWKNALLAHGTLSADQHMLGHDCRLGGRQAPHLASRAMVVSPTGAADTSAFRKRLNSER
jgi:hypothetical protein